jgi:hypothetical protein
MAAPADPALGADGDPEPGRPELEHPGALAGLIALLALAQVPLAVDAAEAAVVAVQLGDVEGRAGPLGVLARVDPVRETSGNTASWQPWALASSSAARCWARLAAGAPFRALLAPSRIRIRPLLSSGDRLPERVTQRSSTA